MRTRSSSPEDESFFSPLLWSILSKPFFADLFSHCYSCTFISPPVWRVLIGTFHVFHFFLMHQVCKDLKGLILKATKRLFVPRGIWKDSYIESYSELGCHKGWKLDTETETPANKTYSSNVTLASPGCLCPGETKAHSYLVLQSGHCLESHWSSMNHRQKSCRWAQISQCLLLNVFCCCCVSLGRL